MNVMAVNTVILSNTKICQLKVVFLNALFRMTRI